MSASSFTPFNKVTLIRGGTAYFELLVKLMDLAEDTVHLQVYIYDDDETGRLIMEAMAGAVKRGVKVYLLADGYASQALPEAFIEEMKTAGIHFRFFEPLFKSSSFYFGRRLHHKIMVTDNLYALVGGINISNRYNDMPDQPAWLDFALLTEGDIVKDLCELCQQTWKGLKRERWVETCYPGKLAGQLPPGEVAEVRMRRNDWVGGKKQISRTYFEMLVTAEKEVSILCSYFLPGRTMRKAIKKAIRRGVTIKVIMAGKSDLPVAKNAERFMYDWLLRYKVAIYEYQQNVLHGKIAVCDKKWITIGSYNINDISAYASIELNLDVKNEAFASHVSETLKVIIENDCLPITSETLLLNRNIFSRLLRWGSFRLFRIGFYMFTFYFRQRL